MRSRKRFIPALLFTAVAAAGIGFAASHVWDSRIEKKVAAERDMARDIRSTGATASPYPLL
jgi:hypothetical protein